MTPAPIRTRASIHLHIHDLVLHRFPADGARQIGDDVASELGRVIAVSGVPDPMVAMHGTEHVDAGVITTPSTVGRGIGRDIAQAVCSACGIRLEPRGHRANGTPSASAPQSKDRA